MVKNQTIKNPSSKIHWESLITKPLLSINKSFSKEFSKWSPYLLPSEKALWSHPSKKRLFVQKCAIPSRFYLLSPSAEDPDAQEAAKTGWNVHRRKEQSGTTRP
jgi:hypothetical protein